MHAYTRMNACLRPALYLPTLLPIYLATCPLPGILHGYCKCFRH